MRELNLNRRRGFVLPVSMIFLIVMTMLAVTAIKKATLDEKVSMNLRAQDLAFQAAEKALRFCEQQLDLAVGSTKSCTTKNGVDILATGEPDPLNPMSSFPMGWANMDNWADGAANGAVRLAGVNSIPNVSTQPQCMIERWAIPSRESKSDRYPYVITARGVGSMNTAVVWLQAIVRCGNF
jgi:type IV pilus assembly protein PilX